MNISNEFARVLLVKTRLARREADCDVLQMLRAVCFILASVMMALFVALLIQRNLWKIFLIKFVMPLD